MYLSTTPVPPDSIPLQSIDDTSEVHNHKGEDYLENSRVEFEFFKYPAFLVNFWPF